MLLNKNEIDRVKLKYIINNNYNYVDIYFDDKKIHSEKLYRVEYLKRKQSIKDKLLFYK